MRLHQALQRVIDLKLTSAREMGELAGVSTSTVYRWTTNQTQPDFESVRLLIRLLPSPRAQEELLNALLGGSAWSASRTEVELDVNHDGVIDRDDALAAALVSVQAATQSLSAIHNAARRPMTTQETLQAVAHLDRAVRHGTLTQRVLIHLDEQRNRRQLKIAQ